MYSIEPTTTYIATFAVLLTGYLTYAWIIYPFYLSPLRKLPGPPPDHFLLGNFMESIRSYFGIDQLKWAEKYGGIYKSYWLFNSMRVNVTDGKLLQQILANEGYDYIKPKGFGGGFKRIIGNGLVLAEGEVHKRQRKLMNPAFNHNCIKDMVPTFARVFNTVKELWKDEIKNAQNSNVEKKMAKINIISYLSKATLDVIGIVGFDYEFNSLTSTSKLAQAYESLVSPDQTQLIIQAMMRYFPILELLPTKRNLSILNAQRVADEVSTKLVQEKLEKYAKGEIDDNKDLLSRLVKANHEEVENENERLSFDELKYQIMTFLIAGHETTSTATTWALHYLSRNQEAQNKLRKEIVKEFPDKDFVPTLEQINSLEYLNAICKETLRLSSPAPMATRESTKDTTMNGYFIPKGTFIVIPIYTIHHMPSIWGPDVEEFRPERWFDDRSINNYNYLPFLSGPRACIGNKMALNEMKTILTILIRNFEFHKVEGIEVQKKLFLGFRPDPALLLVKETDN